MLRRDWRLWTLVAVLAVVLAWTMWAGITEARRRTALTDLRRSCEVAVRSKLPAAVLKRIPAEARETWFVSVVSVHSHGLSRGDRSALKSLTEFPEMEVFDITPPNCPTKCFRKSPRCPTSPGSNGSSSAVTPCRVPTARRSTS